MNKPICPHCGNEYNKGAAVCYNCKRYINWAAWFRMNWGCIAIDMMLLAAVFGIMSFTRYR